MDVPLSESALAAQKLQDEGFYNSWRKMVVKPITFIIHPEVQISDTWMNKRVQAYVENASILGVKTSPLNFYVYPSMDFAKDRGVIASFAIPSKREIHGHFYQSKGHEVTHILLKQLLDRYKWPWSGLWLEGICVLLDRERPDPKLRFISCNYSQEIYQKDWTEWRTWLPDEFYPLAANIMAFLSEKFGWSAVKTFLKQLDFTQKDENVAVLMAFGQDLPHLHTQWDNWRKELQKLT